MKNSEIKTENETLTLNEFAKKINVSESIILLAINESKITAYVLDNGSYKINYEKAREELLRNYLLPIKEQLGKKLQKEIDEMPSIKKMALTFEGIPNELLEGLSDDKAREISKKLKDIKSKIYDTANNYEDACKELMLGYNSALGDFGVWVYEKID